MNIKLSKDQRNPRRDSYFFSVRTKRSCQERSCGTRMLKGEIKRMSRIKKEGDHGGVRGFSRTESGTLEAEKAADFKVAPNGSG